MVKNKVNEKREGKEMKREEKTMREWKMLTHFQVRINYSAFFEAFVLALIIT
jgi:hypothetical protein